MALKWTAAIHVSTCYTLHTPCGQLLFRCPHTACAYCTATYVSSYHILLVHMYVCTYIYIYYLLYWCKRTNTDAGKAAAKTASRRAARARSTSILIYWLYWCKRTNTDAEGAADKTASRRATRARSMSIQVLSLLALLAQKYKQ